MVILRTGITGFVGDSNWLLYPKNLRSNLEQLNDSNQFSFLEEDNDKSIYASESVVNKKGIFRKHHLNKGMIMPVRNHPLTSIT